MTSPHVVGKKGLNIENFPTHTANVFYYFLLLAMKLQVSPEVIPPFELKAAQFTFILSHVRVHLAVLHEARP